MEQYIIDGAQALAFIGLLVAVVVHRRDETRRADATQRKNEERTHALKEQSHTLYSKYGKRLDEHIKSRMH